MNQCNQTTTAVSATHAVVSAAGVDQRETACPPATSDRFGGSIWDYISPTRLNLWLRCPLAYKIRYLDGIKSPSTPALFLGKQVHAALQLFYNHLKDGTPLAPVDVIAHCDQHWAEAVAAEPIAFESTEQETRLRRQLADLLNAYFTERDPQEPPPLYVEQRFEQPLRDPRSAEPLGINLVGIIDLVLDGPAGPQIIDFKTAARAAAPPPMAHEIQLGCYALLLRGALSQQEGVLEAGLEIRGLIKTRTPQLHIQRHPRRTSTHFARLFAAFRAYLADLRQGQFVYRPGPNCSWCDYRNTHCASWEG